MRTAARLIARYPASTSNVLVMLQSRMLTPNGICAREQARLFLQLQHTSFPDAIAPRLFRTLQQEPLASPWSRRGPLSNWVRLMERQLRDWDARGFAPLAPSGYADISRTCNALARAVSFDEMQREARKTVPLPLGPALMPLPVPSHGSTVHTVAIWDHMAVPVAALGTKHGSTPVSIGGPG